MGSALSEHDCAVCEDAVLAKIPNAMDRLLARRFVVCKTCGNKRCPKASWHENECTNSNAGGQAGSYYGPKESWPRQGPGK